MSYWDHVVSLGTVIIYIVGLYIAYRRGEHSVKSRYSELINRLHKQYAVEYYSRNNLLDFLDDIENYYPSNKN